MSSTLPMFRFFITLVVTLSLISCAAPDRKQQAEKTYYDTALEHIEDERWNDAIAALEELETTYPFGQFTEAAQLMSIYSNYKAKDYPAAKVQASRFIRLHPDHAQVDYAYYYKGLAEFDQSMSFFDTYTVTVASKKDPSMAKSAFESFRLLIDLFPESLYLPDAKARMIALKNRVAQYEVYVARFYIRREAYLAAINRAKYVLEHYQRTPSAADALAVMYEAYTILDLPEHAQESLTVLKFNFPNYAALDENGNYVVDDSQVAEKRSFLNIVTFGLFG